MHITQKQLRDELNYFDTLVTPKGPVVLQELFRALVNTAKSQFICLDETHKGGVEINAG